MKQVKRKSEAGILKEVHLAVSKAGCVAFRNETAGAYVGRVLYRQGDEVSLARAQFIQAGLCVGSSDLIGWTPDGRFLAIEVKAERGRASRDQLSFLGAVLKAGGVAGVARSAEDAIALLRDHGVLEESSSLR